jgi:hypothetical protein
LRNLYDNIKGNLLKNILFTIIVVSLCLSGCDPIYKYIPDNSDLYKKKDNKVIYETDTLKLALSSEYMQYSKERHTELSLAVYAKSCDLVADFKKTELHPDIPIQREYISIIEGEDPKDEKGWILKKGKKYQFYIYFTTVHDSFLAPSSRIKNIKINMSKVFQCNNKLITMPEFNFSVER